MVGQADRQVDGGTGRQAGGWWERQAGRQADGWWVGQADQWRVGQTDQGGGTDRQVHDVTGKQPTWWV